MLKGCLDRQRLICRQQDLPASAGDRIHSIGIDPATNQDAEGLEGMD